MTGSNSSLVFSMRLSANDTRSSPLILRVRPVTPLPIKERISFIRVRFRRVIEEHTAVEDFVAVALCAIMRRVFSGCFRKDIAVPYRIELQSAIACYRKFFGMGRGHSPQWFRWLFGVPTASSIDKEPYLATFAGKDFRGESFSP